MTREVGEKNQAVIYGRKGIAELVERAPERVRSLWLAEDANIPRELLGRLEAALAPEVLLRKPRRELDLASNEGVHQGILALIEAQRELSFKEFLQLQQGLVTEESAPLVILDQITDPHNFGAILRSANAAGVAAVLYTSARSCGVTPLVRKASAGGSEFLQLVKLKNLQQSLGQLKELGYWIVGTEVGAASQSLYEADLPSPTALVFGREGEGLRELTIKHCDMLVHLPMRGSVESLNVNQAASIVLYELLRRSL